MLGFKADGVSLYSICLLEATIIQYLTEFYSRLNCALLAKGRDNILNSKGV